MRIKENKAGYTAQDAPRTRLKITGDGRTDRRTDTTSYRDATAHLKRGREGGSRDDTTVTNMKPSQGKKAHFCDDPIITLPSIGNQDHQVTLFIYPFISCLTRFPRWLTFMLPCLQQSGRVYTRFLLTKCYFYL